MPLRCLDPIADRSVHAFDLSADDWRALETENRRARHLRMPCCSAEVTLRRSRRGTPHFAHKAVGACTTAPETEAHLRLKQIAVEAARAAGWEAQTEVAGATPSGGPWRADVLARRGEAQVAVEIQWSPQPVEEILRRQARYKDSGVRGLWLLRQKDVPIDKDLPAARVAEAGEQAFTCSVPTGGDEQTLPAEAFLAAAFGRRLKFGVPRGAPVELSLRVGEMSCWSCGADTEIITGVDLGLGPHKFEFSVSDFDKHPEPFEAIRRRAPNNVPLGAVKPRLSRTQDRRYLSNGCAHCDALIGAFHEHAAWQDQRVACRFAITIDEAWERAIRAHPGGEDVAWGVFASQP